MGIRFYCPNGHKLHVEDHLAGQKGVCPRCGAKMQIPLQSTRRKSKHKESETSRGTPEVPAAPGPVEVLLDDELGAPAAPSEVVGKLAVDDLFSEEGFAAARAGRPLTPAPAKAKGLWRFLPRWPQSHKKEDQWGSPLMLVGGGALLLLVILLGVLFWAINRRGGDEMFRLANEAYRAGSYAQAIQKYEAYLDSFPKHSGASTARVQIGLAQLRQATEGTANWPMALQTADKVLADIATETDFGEAHAELAAMLPAIAEGLAAEVRKNPDPALVEEVRRALAMTEKYVPKSLRPATKLADVEASLALTVRDIARDDQLAKTLTVLEEATNRSKTGNAYSAYRALVRQYPELAGSAKLKAALVAVSAAQQTLVKTVTEQKSPESKEAQTAVLSSVTLAHCNTKTKATNVDGRIVLAAVDGAVYGLEAATGKVLWRRFVGFDANPRAPSLPPAPLSPEPGSDVLAVDTVRDEVLRIEGATGRIVWRRAIGEPFDAPPVIAGEKILIAARGGKLITIAVASGQSTGYVQLPQALRVAPAVDLRRGLAYQVADHTNLFVLSLKDGACKEVVYLGHERESVTIAPVLLGNYLLVAINGGARDAELQVFALQKETFGKAGPWLKPVQRIRVDGHVQIPPLTEGRKVLVTTNRGVVQMLELSAGDATAPLREVASTSLAGGDNLVRFCAMQGAQFWIADKRLTKYEIEAARSRLTPKWIVAEDSVFLQPPVASGQAVVTVRRKLGMPGAIVSAVSMQAPDFLWETELAWPLVGEPLVVSKSDEAVAVTANGSAYRLGTGPAGVGAAVQLGVGAAVQLPPQPSVASQPPPSGQTAAAVVNEPAATADAFRLGKPVSKVLRLPDGLLAISTGKDSEAVGILDLGSGRPVFDWLKLPDKIACWPVSFNRGLLAAGKGGQVSWLDPREGKPLAEPFQPRLEPGMELAWLVPTVINDKEVVLTDGETKIYRLGVEEKPQPHLAALAEATVSEPIVSPLAVLGETLYGCDAKNVLTAFTLPALTAGKQHTLSGRCVWGPASVGKAVLLATDDNQLLCLDAKGDRLWQVKLEYGPLAGAPLQLGDHYVLASHSGIVWRVECATGKELGKVDAACPLGAGPMLLGKRLLVGGHDGTIYEVRQP